MGGIFYFNFYSLTKDFSFNFNFNTYECGFNYFHNKIILYSLQFFNIRISYLIFDIEIARVLYTFWILNFNLYILSFVIFILILIKVFAEEILNLTLKF